MIHSFLHLLIATYVFFLRTFFYSQYDVNIYMNHTCRSFSLFFAITLLIAITYFVLKFHSMRKFIVRSRLIYS